MNQFIIKFIFLYVWLSTLRCIGTYHPYHFFPKYKVHCHHSISPSTYLDNTLTQLLLDQNSHTTHPVSFLDHHNLHLPSTSIEQAPWPLHGTSCRPQIFTFCVLDSSATSVPLPQRLLMFHISSLIPI